MRQYEGGVPGRRAAVCGSSWGRTAAVIVVSISSFGRCPKFFGDECVDFLWEVWTSMCDCLSAHEVDVGQSRRISILLLHSWRNNSSMCSGRTESRKLIIVRREALCSASCRVSSRTRRGWLWFAEKEERGGGVFSPRPVLSGAGNRVRDQTQQLECWYGSCSKLEENGYCRC